MTLRNAMRIYTSVRPGDEIVNVLPKGFYFVSLYLQTALCLMYLHVCHNVYKKYGPSSR